jgi:hypothetical protein
MRNQSMVPRTGTANPALARGSRQFGEILCNCRRAQCAAVGRLDYRGGGAATILASSTPARQRLMLLPAACSVQPACRAASLGRKPSTKCSRAAVALGVAGCSLSSLARASNCSGVTAAPPEVPAFAGRLWRAVAQRRRVFVRQSMGWATDKPKKYSMILIVRMLR